MWYIDEHIFLLISMFVFYCLQKKDDDKIGDDIDDPSAYR